MYKRVAEGNALLVRHIECSSYREFELSGVYLKFTVYDRFSSFTEHSQSLFCTAEHCPKQQVNCTITLRSFVINWFCH